MPTVYVSDEVMDALRPAVLDKHGKLYGAIRVEVENALRHHMDKKLPDHKLTRVDEEEPAPKKTGKRVAVRAA